MGKGLDRDRIVSLDKKRVWHPYTEMSRYREQVDPLVIVRASGSRLYDADGRDYLDGNASWWSSVLGHGHRASLPRCGGSPSSWVIPPSQESRIHLPPSLLSGSVRWLREDGLEHVFYSDNGSTAVEVAMKLALQYWKQNGAEEKRVFVALEDAFHGETLGVTALGGVEVFRRPFEASLLDCVHLPSPAGAAGMQIYDPAFLRAARALCDEHDVFLVCDEVFAGYARTGPMWACEHAGIAPDLLCTAKGFSGGLFPMAATLASDRIFDGFLGDPERAFYYGHTFCGNPLGASVALEVLRVYDEEKVLENIAAKAARISDAFESLAALPCVARVRSKGMVGALDLDGAEGYLAEGGWRVYEEARRRGAYLRPLGNVVYVTPSLNIPDDDLDSLLEILCESVRVVLTAEGHPR